MEDAIEVLTRMIIKEHEKENEEMLYISKKDLLKICVKVLKIIDKSN